MNQKKAKQLRQDMRDMDFNPSEVKYEEGNAPVYLPHSTDANGKLTYNPEGTIYPKVHRGVPKKLAPCGRKLYQDMKKELKLRNVA